MTPGAEFREGAVYRRERPWRRSKPANIIHWRQGALERPMAGLASRLARLDLGCHQFRDLFFFFLIMLLITQEFRVPLTPVTRSWSANFNSNLT